MSKANEFDVGKMPEDERTQEKKAEGLPDAPGSASNSESSDLEKGSNALETSTDVDPNLVTWENATDPKNPKNWPNRDKWIVTFLVSCFLLATLMSSTIISPALPDIAKSLHIHSDVEIQISMSMFVLGYAFGPLFLAPLSELYGRTIVIQVSNVWFCIWSVVSGLSTTKTQMIVSRLLAGIGGSAALGTGGGILSDVWKPEERGRSLALYALVPLLGPAIAPLIGGYITQRASWPWCFYTVGIFEGVLVLLSLFTFKESYAPTILYRKAKSLRKKTGNSKYYTKFEKENPKLLPKLKISLVRPTKFFFTQPIIQIWSLYCAYSFGVLYIVHSTYPSLWQDRYHQSVSQSGLNFISIAVGFTLGAQIAGRLQDRIFAHLRKRAAPTPDGSAPAVIPEYRLPLMVPGALLLPMGLLIYGWCAQARTHWIGPNIGIAIFSAGNTIGSQCQIAYMVDAYPDFTASALAAVSVMRSFAGFGFPLFAPQLYQALDYGWGNTLLAGIALVIGLPMPWVLWKYGARIRAKAKAVS